jgi:hypothetical protein
MNNITHFYSPCGFESLSPNVNIFAPKSGFILNYNEYFKFDINKLSLNTTNLILMNCNPASIEYFSKNILQHIRFKFVIVSFCCDTTFPNDCNGWTQDERMMRGNNVDNITQNPHFVHWFATNKITVDNEWFTSIPYGLNYWTLEHFSFWRTPVTSRLDQDIVIYNIANHSAHFSKRIPIIYANWHHNLTDTRFGGMRSKLQNIIPSNIIYYAPIVSRSDYWSECSKYAFVVSPFGNGMDCIRTWEALCLGCIAIVKSSPIDNLYTDLPVVIVSEWTDITETFLNDKMLEFSNKTFNMEKLTMNYWIEKVKSKLCNNVDITPLNI